MKSENNNFHFLLISPMRRKRIGFCFSKYLYPVLTFSILGGIIMMNKYEIKVY